MQWYWTPGMLIVLHTCSILILHDSGYTSFGDNETIVLYIISNNKSRDIGYDFY